MTRGLIIAFGAIIACGGHGLAGRLPPPREVPPFERGPEPRTLAAPPRGQTNGLARALLGQGYTAVPMQRDSRGLRDNVQVTIGGKEFRLVVDTGATRTYLDRDRTKCVHLNWLGEPERRMKKDELFDYDSWCKVPVFTVGGFSMRGLWAYGFNGIPWNGRAEAGDDQVDGVLGMDVLTAAGAVIDSASRVLYLRAGEVEQVTVTSMSGRGLLLPVVIDPQVTKSVDRVRLLVSKDFGKSWRRDRDWKPGDGDVFFKAPRDGEYWFATQTFWKDGSADPDDLSNLVPSKKVSVRSQD